MIKLWLGSVEAKLASIAPKFSFACLVVIAVAFGSYRTAVSEKTEQATMCLAENIYHEARGESREDQYKIGMLTLARVFDPSRQWAKTICGVIAQKKQFSWVLDYKLATAKRGDKQWAEAMDVAHKLIKNAWSEYFLPKGWECARWYKRTDGKDVSKRSMRFFETRLFPVGSFGNHTAFEDRKGCKDPLPTG